MSTRGMLVSLKLDGDLEQGFQVTLEIGPEGERAHVEETGFLPPAPELVACLDRWQRQYRSLGAPKRIKPKAIIYDGSVTQLESCRQAANQLRDRLTDWLKSESFATVDRCLREELDKHESIRVLIRSQDWQIYRLPWHLWDFLERYPKAEVAFSAPGSQRVDVPSASKKVRILAILGNGEGIDTEADRRLLEALPNAEVVFLVEPPRQQLNDRLWEQAWDILFFAGHSETQGQQGRIYLNSQDSLTIEELKYGLKRAIAAGLKFAIFNSCDGLGLAYELKQLHLPQIIVMREPVPDRVAQEFLKHFLQAFADGQSFYQAQRQARERLQGWEYSFPCASWLPAIYQNSAAVPPSWQELGGKMSRQPRQSRSWRGLRTAMLASIVATGVVIGARAIGLLQASELQAFDQLVQLRPAEEPDQRILVITVDEADIQAQRQMGMTLQGSLADAALAQLLQKILPHQPRVIASDIVHDFPFTPELSTVLEKTPQFIGICRVSNADSELISIPPPPDLLTEQLGFTNFSLDPDDKVRRQLLGMSPDQVCQTDQSLSFRVAHRYLGLPSHQSEQGVQIGDVIFKPLTSHAGGYQLPAQEARGYQILLNYRASDPQQVPLRTILNGDDAQLSQLVNDRIVLIGVASNKQDLHSTPYSAGMSRKPGVIVHAHMVSQIVSAVLDGRSLLWWWSWWGDALWIGGWTLMGGFVVWYVRAPLRQGLAMFVSLGTLLGSCFILFLTGGWVPLVPSALGLLIAGGSVAISQTYSRQPQAGFNRHEKISSFPSV